MTNTNTNTLHSFCIEEEQQSKKSATKLLIITTIDDGDKEDNILSYLNPVDIETVVFSLKTKNTSNTYSTHNENHKQSLPASVIHFIMIMTTVALLYFNLGKQSSKF